MKNPGQHRDFFNCNYLINNFLLSYNHILKPTTWRKRLSLVPYKLNPTPKPPA